MIRIVFFILVFVANIFAAIISANQGKVSVTGGSISVSAQGVTQIVNSGEITFIGEGQAPTKARKTRGDDLRDIFQDLKAQDKVNKVILKFTPVKSQIAKRIRLKLLQKSFDRMSIKIKRKGRLSQLFLSKVPLNSIKTLFPPYYRAAKKFFKKSRNSGKIPILTVRLSHMKRYYRNIFREYDR